MGPNRSTKFFHRIDTQQFGCHAGAKDAPQLNRSTIEPLGLKRTNRDTAVDKARIRFWALQLEQGRRGSRADDPLAIQQLLDRSFRGGEQRIPFVTDSAESEN